MLITDEKVQALYSKIVDSLSPNEQLLLASLILNYLMFIDDHDNWTQEDKNDLISFSLNHSSELLTDSEDII